jgi:hypothetical protein
MFTNGNFIETRNNTNPASVLPFRRVSGGTKVKAFLHTKQDFVVRGFFSEEQASAKKGSATASHYDFHGRSERGRCEGIPGF